MQILHAFRCGDLPLCVGDALGQLRPGGEYLLELVVGDAHREAKFLQMVLGEDAVVFPADEKPDGLVVDRQVRTCRSRTAERLHGDREACLEHAGRQPARRASHLQGTQPRPRQVPFGGTWPADGHHRLRAQKGPPHQGAIGQVRHRRRAADCRGFNAPSYESVKLGHREVIG